MRLSGSGIRTANGSGFPAPAWLVVVMLVIIVGGFAYKYWRAGR